MPRLATLAPGLRDPRTQYALVNAIEQGAAMPETTCAAATVERVRSFHEDLTGIRRDPRDPKPAPVAEAASAPAGD